MKITEHLSKAEKRLHPLLHHGEIFDFKRRGEGLFLCFTHQLSHIFSNNIKF